MQLSQLKYLLTSTLRYARQAGRGCPNCGLPDNPVEDRKALVTQLRRCQGCQLLYRTPTDDPKDNARYYEEEYVSGAATSMPSSTELEQLKRTNFANSRKDFQPHIRALGLCGLPLRGAQLFEFGCSWGYASYQLERAGFEVTAYEVAPTRRRYAAERMGITTVDDFDALEVAEAYQCKFDCFFSCHVLEHVPFPSRVIRLARRLLKPGGVFISFTPNGSTQRRACDYTWHQNWGQVHPNFLDDAFLNREFQDWPRVFASGEFHAPLASIDAVNFPATATRIDLDSLSRPELVFAARKPQPD